MDKLPPELIDQLYSRSHNKSDTTIIDDCICDICKNADKCPESAKRLAFERDNECNASTK
jgi:hypothetical protein